MIHQRIARAMLVGYYRIRLKEVGRRFRIGLRSSIVDPRRVRIGDDVYFGQGTFITTPSEVIIGDRVMFGPEVMLVGGDHDLQNASVPLRWAPAPPPPAPIVIERDCWIGARAIVLKGVTIGHDTVVGAGSVVTKSLPPGVIAAGNPCRVLRRREIIFQHGESTNERT